MPSTLRVAVTQAEPAWLDLDESINRACKLIEEAAANGAQLVAFSECWVTGYPAWIWSRPVDTAFQTRYILNALPVPSPQFSRILSAAATHSIAVVVGFAERTPSNSVYIAQAIISPQGTLALHRRKLKPTHMERTIFGDGSGRDLTTVAALDFGGELGIVNVSCLACWEHTQPLLKYHTASQHPAVHVAMWPPLTRAAGKDDPALWSMTAEGNQTLSQTFAIEAATHVLHCTAVCGAAGIDMMGTAGSPQCGTPGGGHSCVIAPDGRRLTEPLGGGSAEELGIVYADLDLERAVAVKGFLDVVGHYSRPDLLWLGVDRKQKEVVVAREESSE